MVAGKVKSAIGLQKSPAVTKSEAPPKSPHPSPSSAKSGATKAGAVFSRSFGVYFPRSSAQVQPRPPDVSELLRLVEELRERESRLKTELLEFKLLKESAAIVPVLENKINSKNAELETAVMRIELLESENASLRTELSEVRVQFEEERRESEKRAKDLEMEILELKKTLADRESEELSASQRFQGLMEVSTKSNLIRNLKKGAARCAEAVQEKENLKPREEVEIQRPSHSRCNSDELAESTLSHIRSRIPRVPKPPPKRSSSPPLPLSTSSMLCNGFDQSITASQLAPPPPPPPPPPTLKLKRVAPTPPPPPPPPSKGARPIPAKVSRVPEVVEFYHSLMRRDSRRESGAGATEGLPATANARDMIGEIENRSAYLLAVSSGSR